MIFQIILGNEYQKQKNISCYGDELARFCTYGAAKRSCESNLDCKAVRHIGCGNEAIQRPYSTCGIGSIIGIRKENEVLTSSDKKDCIYKKNTGGIYLQVFPFAQNSLYPIDYWLH